MRLVIKQAKTKSKFTKYSLHQFSKTTKWQLGMSLSLTSAAALRAAADKLTPLIYPKQQTSKNLTAERIATKHAAADRAFCADPLAKSPCSSAVRRSVLCFPLPPCFSFSERPLWHGSSRKSTAEKLSRKTFIYLICNNSTAELFFIYSALVKAYVCTNFSFPR